MTEEEAKKRWCPMARTAAICQDQEVHVVNRAPTKDGGIAMSKCVGSDCMMWHQIPDMMEGWCGLNTARTAQHYGPGN